MCLDRTSRGDRALNGDRGLVSRPLVLAREPRRPARAGWTNWEASWKGVGAGKPVRSLSAYAKVGRCSTVVRNGA